MAIPLGATLPAEINLATRKQHLELNRLLINRLPLALPPHQSSPHLLSKGLVPFATIFLLFEVEWELLIRYVQERGFTDVSHDDHVKRWVANLQPDDLPRSPRLKRDLDHLRMTGNASMYKTPELGDEWVGEMRSYIRTKPHTLVAFAWVFYMATFSGGRWIRQQLANAGGEFWTKQDGTPRVAENEKSPLLEMPGFSFLSFDGDQDGEDIKALFKARLAEAENLLTWQEKQDIIHVSQKLFQRCILLVHELDREVWLVQALGWTPTILFGLVFILAIWSLRAYFFPRGSG